MGAKELLIHPADFRSMRLLVSFKNTSTGTNPIPPESCTLVEILDKVLLLELPKASCSRGHSVVLDFSYSSGEETPRLILTATGKVVELEETMSMKEGGGVVRALRVKVSCVQFDEKSWKEMLQRFSARQDAITDFLKSAKGY